VMGSVTKVEMTFFIAVEGGSWAVRGGWPTVVVRIQYFGFDSKEEATGRSVARR
jgi:hypothetical protein